jgi:hypothetical protein
MENDQILRSRMRWEDNTEMDLMNIICEDENWMGLTYVSVKW